MYAALYGSVESLRLLLDRGARTQPTMLVAGTNVRGRRSCENPTSAGSGCRPQPAPRRPYRAAHRHIEHRLLSHRETPERKADAKVALPDGTGAWMLVGTSLDPPIIRLLLDRGVTGRLPLANALAIGCSECFELLLPHAQLPDFSAALRAATLLGDMPRIERLLKRGARAGTALLQVAALAPTPIPAATVQIFLTRGADPSTRTYPSD